MFIGSRMLMGTVLPRVYATWNLTAPTVWSLSGGNLIATNPAGGDYGIRATVGVNNGKWQWENTCSSGDYWLFGASTSSIDLSQAYSFIQSESILYYRVGAIYINGSNTYTGLPLLVLGDILGVTIDLGANTIQFWKNGSAIIAPISIPAGTYFPEYYAHYTFPQSATLNCGQTSLAYPVAGFTAGPYA